MNPNDPNQQSPSLDQGEKSSAQVPGSPNHASPFAAVIPASVQVTTDMMWLAQPPRVQELRKLDGSGGEVALLKRYIGAQQLANEGYQIDRQWMQYPDDPVLIMIERMNMNIPAVAPLGVPSPGYQIGVGGSGPPGVPAGWIKTSLNPEDYPPYPVPQAPPANPATPATSKIIGNLQYDNSELRSYGAGPGAIPAYHDKLIVNNGVYEENGIQYRVHATMGLMGLAISFTVAD